MHSKHTYSRLLVAVIASSLTSLFCTAMAETTNQMEEMYRAAWREEITHIHPPGKGCFHAAYPSTILERTPCQGASYRYLSVPRHPLQDTTKTVGDKNDYVLSIPRSRDSNSHGLSVVFGAFPTATVVGNGPSHYSLQINTNSDSDTAACERGGRLCKVWQQFIYATDYPPGTQSGAGLFMEYWLNTYSLLGHCPDGWNHGPNFSCFKDSPVTRVPYIPATDLANVRLVAAANQNGQDGVMLFYKDDVYASYNDDSVLDIYQIWNEAEFNVFGNGAAAPLAHFEPGTSMTVKISASYPLHANEPPICLQNMGTTAETNDLNLGPCVSVFPKNPSFHPYIQFTESK